MNNTVIGQRISNARNEAGLSTAEVARRIGRSQATISRIENGKQTLSLELLGAFARALNVPALSLVTDLPESGNCPIPRRLPPARDPNRKPLGRMLTAGRRRSRLTPQAAADALGITTERLSAFEAGGEVPDDDLLTRMATLYPLAEDELAGMAHLERCFPRLAGHFSTMEQLLAVFHGCLDRQASGLRLSPAWSEVARDLDEVLCVFNPDFIAAERQADYFSIGHLSDRLLAALQDPAFHRQVESLAEAFAGDESAPPASGPPAPATGNAEATDRSETP